MIVRLERRGLLTVGLNIGYENVRRFFPADRKSIDLEFGDLSISCSLGPAFWSDQPCILDARLGEWLEAKRQRIGAGESEIVLALTPVDGGFFRLYLLPVPNRSEPVKLTPRIPHPRQAAAASFTHA